MRVLFSCTASEGHFRPLVPLARACVEAGHDVAFATAGLFGDRVESAGFRVLAAGMDQAELSARHEPYRRELLSMPPNERRPYGFSSRFALIDAPAKLADLRLAAGDWQPDLIVHESADLAAPIVAATLGVPSVHHGFGASCHVPATSDRRRRQTCSGGVRDSIRSLCGAFRGRYIDICPPSPQSESVPAGVPVLRLRAAEPEAVNGASIPWGIRLPERPIVYGTLGTAFNDPSIFRLLLAAFAGLDCNVLATIGRGNDPASLEPLPENAVVERYIPQAQLLPHADLVVGHGGSGSTLGALAHGLPQLLLPQGADQFENANACRSVGAARLLMPDQLTGDAARAEISALLDDPSYRARAKEIAGEIAGMPSADDVVQLLTGEVRAPLS